MTQTATKTQKIATVLFTYIFKHICRVCFVVLSSDGETRYHTCFDNGKASCTCPAGQKSHICYHVTQLRPRYNAIVASKQQEITSPAQAEDEDEVVSVKVGDVTVCSSRKHIANAVAHTKWSQEMAAYARAKDAERARTRTATPDEVAAVEEVKAEAKMAAFQQGMDEQYARDPRQGLSQGERETAISNMCHLYDEY